DCRFQNPEDLAALPGDAGLLVSQMGQMDGSVAGDLALYMPGGAIDVLFPGPALTDDRSWGDASCAPPDEAAFSPHGLDLLTRADGRLMLLVVNHGGRESVEFFEVTAAPVPALTWRGCAEDPGNAAFNDVVGRSDGGFYVTHMFPQDGQMGAMLQGALLGSDTGHVYAWSPEGGWSVVPGSEGPFPNGIELAEDESALYINMYLAGEVRKLDLETGEVLAVYAGGNPDNSTWAADGRLLVATHIAGLTETTACQDIAEGSCGFAFRIVALDPESLAAETVLEHGGAPMGGATVALEVGETLYLGTFAGDRIAAYRP
ncbi:MAG: SMP-30/gluconolactonase/LRE family protein, partial [Pseudomonadota bacterium]